MTRALRLLALLWLAPFLLAAVQRQDEAPNRAAVVVRLADDQVEERCVAFAEETVTGYELLQRAGLALVADETGAGVSICSVEGEGCPADDCFCRCRGEPCTYWSYWQWRDGDWQYAVRGASTTSVGHGAVEGWSWGPGSVTEAIPPPAASFERICAAGAVDMSASSAPPASAFAATNILSYALFGVLLLLLGAALWWSRRSRAA